MDHSCAAPGVLAGRVIEFDAGAVHVHTFTAIIPPGAFQVRTYQRLIRHWFRCQVATRFLSEPTARLRGGGSMVTFEQVAEVVNTCATRMWRNCRHSWPELDRRSGDHQRRNAASCERHRERRLRAGSG